MLTFDISHRNTFDILVVDDSHASLKLLVDILEKDGYHVRPANSGELALRSVQAKLPSLILLDIKMPGLDGYETCRRLKADEKTRSIPVVFISALENEADHVKGFELGGVDFITKPFHVEEILARVNLHIHLRRTQLELETAVQQYAELYDFAPVGYFTLGKNADILQVNKKGEDLIGVQRSSLINHQFDEFVVPEYRMIFNSFLIKTILSKSKESCEIMLVKEGLEHIWTQLEAACSEDQEIVHLAVIDITQHKLNEDVQRQTNAYLENLINYANAPIIVWDPQFKITRFNHAFEGLTGLSEHEVLGKSLEILFPSDLVISSMELIRKTISGERWEAVEINILHVDGTIHTVLWNSATLFSADGKMPIATIAQGQDITDRKKMELSLQQRLHEFETINKLSSAMRVGKNLKELLFILLKETLKVVNSTEGCILLFDPANKQLKLSEGSKWFQKKGDITIPLEKCAVGRVFKTNEPYISNDLQEDKIISDLNPGFFPPQSSGVFLPIRGESGNLGVFMIFFSLPHKSSKNEIHLLTIISQFGANAISRSRLHDQVEIYNIDLQEQIRQKVLTQELLAAEKELLSTTLMSIAEGVIITDNADAIVLYNRAAESLTGFPLGEVIDQPLRDVFQISDPHTRQAISDPIHYLFEMELLQEKDPGYKSPLLLTKSGEMILVSGSIAILQSISGEKMGHVLVFQNITEKHRAEAQMLLSQKMEAIGQLAAGIAHEINTPIQYVGDNLRFVQKMVSKLSEVMNVYQNAALGSSQSSLQENIEQVNALIKKNKIESYLQESPIAIQEALDGVERVRKIVLAMREFSHPSEKEKKPADINHGIETTVAISRNEWKYYADLETDLHPDIPPVSCLIDEINQVVLNMIVNASQSIQEKIPVGSDQKGKILIRTNKFDDKVVISIQDTGKGIPEEIRMRIFEPFFTTKGVGKGTGQGLSMAHNIIVKKHQGAIKVDSSLGQGTTFMIELPIDSSKRES